VCGVDECVDQHTLWLMEGTSYCILYKEYLRTVVKCW